MSITLCSQIFLLKLSVLFCCNWHLGEKQIFYTFENFSPISGKEKPLSGFRPSLLSEAKAADGSYRFTPPAAPVQRTHPPQNPPIQTPPKPPGTVPPAVRAITTHPLQFHNGRTGWPQAMQIFAANREDWRQRLENGKSVEKIYIPYIHLKIAHLR